MLKCIKFTLCIQRMQMCSHSTMSSLWSIAVFSAHCASTWKDVDYTNKVLLVCFCTFYHLCTAVLMHLIGDITSDWRKFFALFPFLAAKSLKTEKKCPSHSNTICKLILCFWAQARILIQNH